MLAYSTYEEHNVDSVTMRDYTANITGDLFQMPAGPLGVALGAEYLENDGFDHPDSTTATGNTSGNVSTPTDGREWSNAEYVEFNIPLLSDMFLAHSLNLDIANRWTQIKWKGGQPGTSFYGQQNSASATTGRAALKWQPTDDLLLRGSWSQASGRPAWPTCTPASSATIRAWWTRVLRRRMAVTPAGLCLRVATAYSTLSRMPRSRPSVAVTRT